MKWTAFPSAWKGTAGIDEPSSLEIKTLLLIRGNVCLTNCGLVTPYDTIELDPHGQQ